ncbi:unnamed protein product [Cyclocybe aegerita]|uniref:Cytochrome P450 n=1 Tax=Cyclocybe aegerita TaxID=1973307 RepID=A0A8S0WIN4_CYCAE|nr:unnamed protein product [Cyclocybe aegerita]
MSFAQVVVFLVAVLTLGYIRLRRGISYSGGVPRVGKPGVWGYIQTAIKYTLDAENLIIEGRTQFDNKPFVLPTLSGPIFILGPEYLERVRSGPDSVFSEIIAVNEDLQLPYTMDANQLDNPVQAHVMRTDVNRAIPAMIPEIFEESVLAMDETFKIPNGQDSISIPIFDTMTHLIARISNRVIFGEEMCRDEGFLHAIVRFAETTPMMAPFIQWSPVVLRPIVYFVLSSLFGGKKGALKYAIPHLERYMKKRQSMTEKPKLVSEFMIQGVPQHEKVQEIAVRLLNLNFGSIHTSSIFITQTLFELVLLPPSDIESMRQEIGEALECEGGWTKEALDKLNKVDSALREIGRYYGLMHFALPRCAVVGYDLGNGTHIPPGYRVAIDMKRIHFNPDTYPDPNRCDIFRFSKLRSEESSGAKYAFATVDSNYLPFGAGRHACAGRQFASMELKIMLAHILLKYDVSLPPGITERPKNVIFNGAIVPDTKANLIFKPRSGHGGKVG